MSLTLTIVNQPTMESGQIMTKTIEQRGTIGRAASNDWVLLDKSRYISGKHGSIEKINDAYQITDTSTNGIYLNNTVSAIGNGGVATLKDGDQLLIGEFEITVSIQEDVAFSSPAATPNSAPNSHVGLEPNGPMDPLALFPQSNTPNGNVSAPPVPSQIPNVDPLSGFGGDAATPASRSEADNASPLHEPFQPPNAIPDDWSFGEEPTPSQASAAPPSPKEASPNANPAANAANILPNDFKIASTEQTPPVERRRQSAPSPRQVIPTTGSGQDNNAAPRLPTASAADNAAALQAFLGGLGMSDLSVPEQDVPAFMHNVGLMLRQTIQGSMSMLRARSNIKSGFRMSMTTIQALENNPLKFCITVDEAINNMFSSRSNSYLQPVQALQEGFNDIENHQLAVMAGMQAALKALIERFDPENLEPMFKQKGVGSKLLSGNKKASYWDAYANHFTEIAKYVDDDFQTVFGDEFSKAYETQIAKLNIMKK